MDFDRLSCSAEEELFHFADSCIVYDFCLRAVLLRVKADIRHFFDSRIYHFVSNLFHLAGNILSLEEISMLRIKY